ncbi:MAG: hypothetical protein K0Q72_218 [Armatimonadetes bacterium]|jgi:hypothetical protein|nr:hypothetical protein [Armatimonadota bacterium]
MVSPECRPKRGVGVLVQEVSGATVLLKPDNGQYYSLEEVSGLVWSLCDGENSVCDIVARVCSEYDATPEEAAADVQELLKELADERLVTTHQ